MAAIGPRLRAARTAAGLTLRQLRTQWPGTPPGLATLSRWERDQGARDPEDVERYLRAAGAPDQKIRELVQVAVEQDATPWLVHTVPDRERQTRALIRIERAATEFVAVNMLLVPGLLQDPEYTRAMMVDDDLPQDEVDERVTLRYGRRQILMQPNPPTLTAAIGEAALLSNIGGDAVMRRQLRSLLEVSQMPNVTLRIIPLRAGYHPGLKGQFLLIKGPDGTIVQADTHSSALFYRQPTVVASSERSASKVLEKAMSPAESAGLIEEYIDRKESTNGDDTRPA
jgi:transcriptional regulator with XRE-family HTH domain